MLYADFGERFLGILLERLMLYEIFYNTSKKAGYPANMAITSTKG